MLAELTKLNIGVVSYKPAASALEDVYLNLIKETLRIWRPLHPKARASCPEASHRP